MKNTSPITLAAAALFLAASFSMALAQTAKKPAPAKKTAASAAAASAAAVAAAKAAAPAAPVDQPFAPGFDDLMTMLIQPRHIKLYYAGTAQNWELAASESRDLRQALGRVMQTIPTYLGNDVNSAMGKFMVPKLDAIDAALAVGDLDKFNAAYKDLTASCNECHTYMERPYHVIKVPDAAVDQAHIDQDFKPAP